MVGLIMVRVADSMGVIAAKVTHQQV